MKHLWMTGLLLCGVGGLLNAATPTVIPLPAEMSQQENAGEFVMNRTTALFCESENPALKLKTEQLRSLLNKGTGLNFSAYDQPGNVIRIVEDPELLKHGKDAYRLITDNQKIEIRVAAPEGIFYAGQTLTQLMPTDFFATSLKTEKPWPVPGGLNITDYPRFAWRALLMDEGRYFFGEATIKQVIDQMALLKMNILHWHLTDDGGWRIEIKKYPKLTSIGSKRDNSEIGTWNSGKYDNKPHQGFYTQDQIRDIVAYAAARNITIMPEIEMPSHSGAAIVAYPELSLTKLDKIQPEFVKNIALDPTKESTYTFISNVLDEVVTLFPSQIIHIGGDEVRFSKEWQGKPEIEAYMKEKGLKSMTDLQVHFTNRVSQIVKSKGRTMMGWNEILGNDLNGENVAAAKESLDPDAVIQVWKGSVELARGAAEKGHKVVNSNHGSTYIDYSYGSIPLRKSYEFEPMFNGLDSKYHHNVIGSGCQMWTEWAPNVSKLHYQMFPRLCAYAEVGWTPAAKKNFFDFQTRMKPHFERMDYMGIQYASGMAEILNPSDFFNIPKAGTWNSEMLKGGETFGFDVSKLVTKPGTYKFSFLYQKGECGATIGEVSLIADGKEIAADDHAGFAGINPRKPIYKLTVKELSENSSVKLKVTLKGDGGNDSHGTIYVEAP